MHSAPIHARCMDDGQAPLELLFMCTCVYPRDRVVVEGCMWLWVLISPSISFTCKVHGYDGCMDLVLHTVTLEWIAYKVQTAVFAFFPRFRFHLQSSCCRMWIAQFLVQLVARILVILRFRFEPHSIRNLYRTINFSRLLPLRRSFRSINSVSVFDYNVWPYCNFESIHSAQPFLVWLVGWLVPHKLKFYPVSSITINRNRISRNSRYEQKCDCSNRMAIICGKCRRVRRSIVLTGDYASASIWLERMHVLIVGPELRRVTKIYQALRKREKKFKRMKNKNEIGKWLSRNSECYAGIKFIYLCMSHCRTSIFGRIVSKLQFIIDETIDKLKCG